MCIHISYQNHFCEFWGTCPWVSLISEGLILRILQNTTVNIIIEPV